MEIAMFSLSQADAWDKHVLGTDAYTAFHCMAWAKVLADSYGFTPSYLMGREGNGIVAIPFMTVPRLLLGAKGVCLPFSDACGPVFTDPWMLEKVVPFLFRLAKRRQWRSFELRGDYGIPTLTPHAQYFEHVISLKENPEEMFKAMRSSTRRNIQHAAREGVNVEICNSAEAVDDYYRLHCITRKRHGVPPQPKKFFRSIYTHMIEPQKGFVARALFREKTVASAVFLHFGTKAIYKFGASLPSYFHLRPSNLVMWEAIKWYSARGFDSLSLGRTDPDDEGLMQFKNGWGGECRIIHYCRWPPRQGGLAKRHKMCNNFLATCLGRLPVTALRFIGTIGYRFSG